MKKLLYVVAILMVCSCGGRPENGISISDEVLTSNFVGVGVEWDPYDDAMQWCGGVSEQDWQTLYERLDLMKPGYVRCMINSPSTYYVRKTDTYDKNRNNHLLTKLLEYCQSRDVHVVFGEFNPPTWKMKDSQRWIDMSMDYLNHLVVDKGFTCIKNFVIFNEPDGYWASTNGDFELWISVLERFNAKKNEYPGLAGVSFAAPDVVINYRNPASAYDHLGWVEQTAARAGEITGMYDVHAYPGQAEVRSGDFHRTLEAIRAAVPSGREVLLGEAGYKYYNDRDTALLARHLAAVEAHPLTKGSDCNMMVFDEVYAVDMPLLITETLSAGFTGIAAWMLDDAMHCAGDNANFDDLKIWGMWNILGAEAFGDPSQEEIRPWYWTYSLMSRAFGQGCNIMKISGELPSGVSVAAATLDGRISVALVNVGENEVSVPVNLGAKYQNVSTYCYIRNASAPEAVFTPVSGPQTLGKTTLTLAPESVTVISNMI